MANGSEIHSIGFYSRYPSFSVKIQSEAENSICLKIALLPATIALTVPRPPQGMPNCFLFES